MRIVLQGFEGCPHWRIADRNLRTLIEEGLDATVTYEQIKTHDQAVKRDFAGSPTVLIDGVDAFTEHSPAVGLAFRVYNTEQGPAGSPSLDQLRAVVSREDEEITSTGKE